MSMHVGFNRNHRFSPSLLDEIRDRLPVSQVVARKVALKRAGRELKGLSPFKQERTPSFFVNDHKGSWFDFSSGQNGDIFKFVMLMERLSFPEAVRRLALEAGIQLREANWGPDATRSVDRCINHTNDRERLRAADEQKRLCKARRLWCRRQPLAGSVAVHYLRSARGYGGPLPPTLGFLPAIGEHPPALIAAFAFANGPEPGILSVPDHAVRAVHITRLLPDGSDRQRTGEADKFMLGLVRGTPIVLAPPNDGLGLAITEGIEDGLSACANEYGVWTAGSGEFMPALADKVPAYIECVTIYQHENESGRRNGQALAQALTERGIEIRIAQAERA